MNFPDDFDTKWRTKFRRQLKTWYAKHSRPLPWRATRDPYQIWISEIMLQQTTVTAVVPYFDRFLTAFPDVGTLAAATEQDVLRHWEGLGYYSRARNIHKAARMLMDQFDGRFPRTVEGIQSLPGIGRYTAGAIAAFAFDLPAPIVEANTLRLYCRLMGFADDPRTAAGQRRLWEFAELILPRADPGLFNQALMELGSQVCRPADPDCPGCPVKSGCVARRDNLQHVIPRAKQRPQITEVTEACVAVCRQGRYLLRRRTTAERWAGLWDFVRFEISAADAVDISFPRGKRKQRVLFEDDQKLTALLHEEVLRRTGVQVTIRQPVREIRHAVTRYRIRLLCFAADYVAGTADSRQEFAWVAARQFPEYPFSVTGRKLAESLQVID